MRFLRRVIPALLASLVVSDSRASLRPLPTEAPAGSATPLTGAIDVSASMLSRNWEHPAFLLEVESFVASWARWSVFVNLWTRWRKGDGDDPEDQADGGQSMPRPPNGPRGPLSPTGLGHLPRGYPCPSDDGGHRWRRLARHVADLLTRRVSRALTLGRPAVRHLPRRRLVGVLPSRPQVGRSHWPILGTRAATVRRYPVLPTAVQPDDCGGLSGPARMHGLSTSAPDRAIGTYADLRAPVCHSGKVSDIRRAVESADRTGGLDRGDDDVSQRAA